MVQTNALQPSRYGVAQRAPGDLARRAPGGRGHRSRRDPARAKDGSLSSAHRPSFRRLAQRRARVVDCEGRWITPALIDCHTHLVYAGDRAQEFELRLPGATYEEIARKGGGILSNGRATRERAKDECWPRRSLVRRIAEGVGAVEIKSGYGLDLEAERKSLRAARRLAEQRNVTIRATFLVRMRCRRNSRQARGLSRICRRHDDARWRRKA